LIEGAATVAPRTGYSPPLRRHGTNEGFLFHPEPPAGGAGGADPGAHQSAAGPLRARAVRVSRRRYLLRRALPAGPAGTRAGGAPDEPGGAGSADGDPARGEAGHRPL